MNRIKLVVMVLTAGTVLLTTQVVSSEGSGQVRIGYVILDEEGHLGVNHETYNIYEGPSISLDGFRYQFDNGLSISSNLQDITLNNRNLQSSISKPGLFSLSIYNNQYRRIYNFNGDNYTRRRTTGGQASVSPLAYLKVFGGYTIVDKHGDDFSIISPVSDTVINSADYTHTSFNLGAQLSRSEGNIRLEYRHFDLTDDIRSVNNREANSLTASLFFPIPQYEKVVLSGGYFYRQDNRENASIDLTTNQGWAGARAYLPQGIVAEYRFLAARTENTGNQLETDYFTNTVSVGINKPRFGGLRIGYENRIADDLIDRTVSNSVLFSGWYRINDKLHTRGRFSTRIKELKTGITLIGDEDFTRHQISIKYREKDLGELQIRYQGRIRTNDDIKTRVEYNAVTAGLNLKSPQYGRLEITYSYYLGKFENRVSSNPDEFEFSDHVLTGMVYSVEYRDVETAFGGTYYRSKRDRDIEKFGIKIMGRYHLPYDYELEVWYQAVNYDDFLVNDKYYTGNIVNIYLIKSFML